MLGFIIDSRIEEDVNGERVRILVVACGGVEKGRGDRRREIDAYPVWFV